jgi:hypothetical protein
MVEMVRTTLEKWVPYCCREGRRCVVQAGGTLLPVGAHDGRSSCWMPRLLETTVNVYVLCGRLPLHFRRPSVHLQSDLPSDVTQLDCRGLLQTKASTPLFSIVFRILHHSRVLTTVSESSRTTPQLGPYIRSEQYYPIRCAVWCQSKPLYIVATQSPSKAQLRRCLCYAGR